MIALVRDADDPIAEPEGADDLGGAGQQSGDAFGHDAGPRATATAFNAGCGRAAAAPPRAAAQATMQAAVARSCLRRCCRIGYRRSRTSRPRAAPAAAACAPASPHGTSGRRAATPPSGRNCRDVWPWCSTARIRESVRPVKKGRDREGALPLGPPQEFSWANAAHRSPELSSLPSAGSVDFLRNEALRLRSGQASTSSA